jgi:hypothetical protein
MTPRRRLRTAGTRLVAHRHLARVSSGFLVVGPLRLLGLDPSFGSSILPAKVLDRGRASLIRLPQLSHRATVPRDLRNAPIRCVTGCAYSKKAP